MKQEVAVGQQDYTVLVYIPDPASTDGGGKTGLNAAALTASYVRVETDNDVTVTDVTSSLSDLSALTDSHADWGLKEVSSTLAPGLYRLDIADAVFLTGAWSAVVYVMITSSAAAASPMEFVLTPEAPYSRLIAPTATENADALLKRDWTEVSSEAERSVLNALRFLRNKRAIATGTLTIMEEDDSTPAWTADVTGDAEATPIVSITPA